MMVFGAEISLYNKMAEAAEKGDSTTFKRSLSLCKAVFGDKLDEIIDQACIEK